MKALKSNEDFLVRENAGLNLLIGAAFLLMFIITLNDKVDAESQQGYHFKAMHLALLPAVFFILRLLEDKRTIFRINKRGIYYYGQFVTGWDNLIKTWYGEEQVTESIQDNFMLYVRYQKADGKIYQCKFPLTNTQDKAEEEIVTAIKFYFNKYQQDQ